MMGNTINLFKKFSDSTIPQVIRKITSSLSMLLLVPITMMAGSGCATTGPVIIKKSNGDVVFKNRTIVGPGARFEGLNDFDGAYSIVDPENGLIYYIEIKSGQAVEEMSADSPVADLTKLLQTIQGMRP